jgi:hypothetical protein
MKKKPISIAMPVAWIRPPPWRDSPRKSIAGGSSTRTAIARIAQATAAKVIDNPIS